MSSLNLCTETCVAVSRMTFYYYFILRQFQLTCPDFSKLPESFPIHLLHLMYFSLFHHICHGIKIILWTSKHLTNLTCSELLYKEEDHYYSFGWWDVQDLLLRNLPSLSCQEIVTAYMSLRKPESMILSYVSNVQLEDIQHFLAVLVCHRRKEPHRFCICQSLQMSHWGYWAKCMANKVRNCTGIYIHH